MSDSLADLLGGRRGALDATVPPVVFGLVWLLANHSIGWAAGAACAVALVIAVWRGCTGGKATAVLGSLAAVAAGALVALYTGRAQDFFLIRLLSNVGSGLAWAVSILIRWPLLGVVVGTVLGQKARWRRDPDLLRAYGRASWVWVFGQYTLRSVVFALLWWSGSIWWLTVAQIALSWPLVALVLAASAIVLRRTLPADHPGLRHPRVEVPAD
ncbi:MULTISPECIES: DUF3159 domain-containing protein [Actinokineospora]|uniref:DUF3159 domain-containing protein n=1 Tax=Actinokineospora fastidiosa TaxID=1816 RepID=A0A918G421_9PSEU|nr:MULTISPECIES: DUF3159 domain-containing protein [Actinokineospora]UVS76739.1 hypothetical protein Actkin_00434 [Actinokineospora sp. UTMC 2448]GGS16106.1 hypothetical protein GCM10010171_05320 [Actinokineospora fastidiosa]